MDCVFCKIARGELSSYKVYEDENFLAFLDITPVNPGHVLLIPKEHYKDLFELPNNVLREMAPLLKKVARAVKGGMQVGSINIGMNNGKAAGQLVGHAHIHIMPRFEGDGYKLWHGEKYSAGEAEKVLEKIISSLPLT